MGKLPTLPYIHTLANAWEHGIMAKVNQRKIKEPYVLVQFRLKPRERNRLRVLCAELGISMQQLILRLLKNQFAEITNPCPNPENPGLKKYRELIAQKEVAEITTNSEDKDETLA